MAGFNPNEWPGLDQLVKLILREREQLSISKTFVTALVNHTKSLEMDHSIQRPDKTIGMDHNTQCPDKPANLRVLDIQTLAAGYRNQIRTREISQSRYLSILSTKLTMCQIRGTVGLVHQNPATATHSLTYIQLGGFDTCFHLRCFTIGKSSVRFPEIKAGQEICISNPDLAQRIANQAPTDFPLALCISSPSQIQILGNNASFGHCQTSLCTRLVDVTKGRYCEFHVLQNAANPKYKRADIQTSLVQNPMPKTSVENHEEFYKYRSVVISTKGNIIHKYPMNNVSRKRKPAPQSAETLPIPKLGRSEGKDPSNQEDGLVLIR